MALDWNNIIVEDDENSQVQDTPVTILASGTPGSPISWDKLIIEEEETTVEGEDESVMIFASGIPGHSATIDGVTAETLPEGSEVTVENVGTPDNARFHFGIPKGDQGERGEKGDQGERGEKGDAGIGSAEYDAENERVIFNGVDENEVYTIDETDALLNDKLDARDTELTGSIVSFEAENDHAIKDLKVEINPIQDLHGLPNPYPAGGGKNLYDISTATTGFILENGSITSNANWKLSDYIPVKTDVVTISWISSSNFYQVRIFSYDSNKSPIANSLISVQQGNTYAYTFTLIGNPTYIRFGYSIAVEGSSVTRENVQLESGSSATSYAPYENICPITGWDEVNVTRTGKNLFDKTTVTTGKCLIASGAETTKSWGNYSDYIRVLPSTAYFISHGIGTNALVTGCYYDAYKNYISGINISGSDNISASFTTPSNCAYIRINVHNDHLDDCQLELGSSASAYEPYQGTEVTVDLGDTRYGGILDVTTGVLTVDMVSATFDGSDDEGWLYNSGANGIFYKSIADMKIGFYINGFCNWMPLTNAASVFGIRIGASDNSIYCYQVTTTLPSINNLSAWKTYLASNNLQLVYPLATPFTVQLSPNQISTLIGINHLWADTGDSTVTLRLPTGDLAYQDTVDYETQVTNKPDFASMLSGTEATMKATKNYSAGALIAVGDDLYKALSAIASGTTLTVGSNVTATTIESELALKANATDVTTALALKANSADVYTKTEVDALVESEITSYHDDEKATVITETASGSIVNITDGSPAPVTDLNVTIEPIQDLHGYDKPWVAGGGKNLIDKPDITVTSQRTIATMVLKAGTYSFSCFVKDNSNISGSLKINYTEAGSIKQIIFAAGTNNTVKAENISIENDDTSISMIISGSVAGYNYSISQIQCELGSTATSYAPYENICPISGWDEAVVTRTGKNLCNAVSSNTLTYLSYTNYSVNDSTGEVTVTGNTLFGFLVSVKPNTTYTFSCNFSGVSSNTIMRVREYGAKPTEWSGSSFITQSVNMSIASSGDKSVSVTVSENTYYILLTFYASGVSSSFTISNVQLELGSTASTFEPYQGQQVTIDLGEERYGGVVDVLTGTMTVTHAQEIIDASTRNVSFRASHETSGIRRFNLWGFGYSAPYRYYKDSNVAEMWCDSLKPQYDALTTLGTVWCKANTLGIVFPDQTIDTVEKADAYITENPITVILPLATPLTVQLSPSQLSTILGENHIWSDTGDTEATYRADTKLYIQKLTKPTEDDMIANNNIAANTFFLVGNNLYFATSAIATGTTIVPGSNCTALSLADALNNLNA